MTQAMPPIPPSAIDYDERPGGGSSTAPIIGILVAVIVLLVAGFAVFVMFNDDDGNTTEVAKAASGAGSEPSADAPPSAPEASPDAGAVRGALTVQATPADASVTVDGNPVAGESPFVVTNLDSGKHKVAIAKDGYLPVEREIDLTASGIIWPVTLQHRDVTLILESDPADAAMNLIADGKVSPMGTGSSQYQLTRQPGVKYEVEAIAKGYHTRRVPLDFSGGAQQKVTVALVRNEQVAVAPVQAPPAEPSTSSSRPRKKTPPRRGGGGRSSGGGGSDPGPTSPPSTSSSKTTGVRSATLHIGTNRGVAPAEIYIDGVRKGKTPMPNVKVTPGRHAVKFRWSDGREVVRRVEVSDGGSAVVRAGVV
jgi:hypothetical protein